MDIGLNADHEVHTYHGSGCVIMGMGAVWCKVVDGVLVICDVDSCFSTTLDVET